MDDSDRSDKIMPIETGNMSERVSDALFIGANIYRGSISLKIEKKNE